MGLIIKVSNESVLPECSFIWDRLFLGIRVHLSQLPVCIFSSAVTHTTATAGAATTAAAAATTAASVAVVVIEGGAPATTTVGSVSGQFSSLSGKIFEFPGSCCPFAYYQEHINKC